MRRMRCFQVVALAALVVTGGSKLAAASLSDTMLSGTVKSVDGKPMEGVAVSARPEGKTFSVTVYTDQAGKYTFPTLEDGTYKMWAQAVRFDTARATVQIASTKKAQENFTLKPLADFEKQLSGSEWIASLPDSTEADHHAKQLLVNYCTGCHGSAFPLQNRFDAKGWGILIDYMSNTTVMGTRVGSVPMNFELMLSIPDYSGPKQSSFFPMIQAHKAELVDYLARVRGPNSKLDYKPFPRPTGESTQVVITEYDIPTGDVPGYAPTPNGTIWSDGMPSWQEARGVHDASICGDGNVYFSDSGATDGRTMGKLDPRTGKVTSYMLKQQKNDIAVAIHGVVCDPNGSVWITNISENTTTRFDPQTGQFQRFPVPDGVEGTGGSMVMDSKGMLWVDTVAGFTKFNPKTGEYTAYKSVTPGGGKYGAAVDADDNIWISQMAFDILGKLSQKTGELTEVRLPSSEISKADEEINNQNVSMLASPYLGHKGPRRSGPFRSGDSVYFPEYWGNAIARINIHTNAVKEYPLPIPAALPYNVMADKNGNIWVDMFNAERFAKFNPTTEKFTVYKLPSMGYETRYIDVDNSTDPPTVWVPASRTNKIARVQFRTAAN